jgi:hypothetical protein
MLESEQCFLDPSGGMKLSTALHADRMVRLHLDSLRDAASLGMFHHQIMLQRSRGLPSRREEAARWL